MMEIEISVLDWRGRANSMRHPGDRDDDWENPDDAEFEEEDTHVYMIITRK